ncbi:MAG: ACP S-malonyltransferase [Pseudomonadota bacterium]|nr:ACP S-malonyltransferase [Pseudomonadota bacterium]MDO7710047.1 ACP S-malonyltransferase [Pseudomonadota bacterium]
MSLAFVFPGQGSQSVGMLSQLATQFPHVQDTFSEASEVLGYDLWRLVSEGPVESLNQTDRTQPAMLAAGIAVWRSWQSVTDITPSFLAGHSLGEYTALVAAGAMAFADAIKLVEQRGLFMQQAVPVGTGAMAAILGLDDDIVRAICSQASANGIVDAVNFNSPGQVVIAGQAEAVNVAIILAKEQGAKRALLLPVSVPSHCALMKPAAKQLEFVLADITIQVPTIPVIHNVSVTNENNSEDIKRLLTEQLYSPVRWVETVQSFATQGVDTLIECGPGKVLAGLTKRIDKSLVGLAVFDQTSLDKAIQTLGEV